MYLCCCFKRKRKSRRFSLILLPFTHRANGSLLFVLTLDYALVCTIRHSTAQYIIIRGVTPRGPVKVHSNKSNRVTPSGPCDSSPPQG